MNGWNLRTRRTWNILLNISPFQKARLALKQRFQRRFRLCTNSYEVLKKFVLATVEFFSPLYFLSWFRSTSHETDFQFQEEEKSMLERDEGCRLTVEKLEFCFSRETSVRWAPCARKRCRCEATSCVPSKVPVVLFRTVSHGRRKMVRWNYWYCIWPDDIWK
jgi:hypothetical protein